jgi:hypothetical protein
VKMDWIPFLWFAGALIALVLLERWIHRHLQGATLLLTGDPEAAVLLYALPLLPGVVLHEVSHALMGLLVGARVGRISILPARSEGRIQLGFVPVEATGPVRTALIGLAPLITGCLVLLMIGSRGLRLGAMSAALAAGDWAGALAGLDQAIQAPDAGVWAYLCFAISNTMLPSRSDMRAWPIIIIFLALVAGVVFLLGLGPSLVGPLSDALRWLAVACGLTFLIDLPFAGLIFGLEKLLERVKGMKVEYQ